MVTRLYNMRAHTCWPDEDPAVERLERERADIFESSPLSTALYGSPSDLLSLSEHQQIHEDASDEQACA